VSSVFQRHPRTADIVIAPSSAFVGKTKPPKDVPSMARRARASDAAALSELPTGGVFAFVAEGVVCATADAAVTAATSEVAARSRIRTGVFCTVAEYRASRGVCARRTRGTLEE
jgi:hypothetical protein